MPDEDEDEDDDDDEDDEDESETKTKASWPPKPKVTFHRHVHLSHTTPSWHVFLRPARFPTFHPFAALDWAVDLVNEAKQADETNDETLAALSHVIKICHAPQFEADGCERRNLRVVPFMDMPLARCQ